MIYLQFGILGNDSGRRLHSQFRRSSTKVRIRQKLHYCSSCQYTHRVACWLLGPHNTPPCVLISIIGRILNRFSKDIGFMDDLLPYYFNELFTVSIKCNLKKIIVYFSIYIATAEVHIYYVGRMCGQLLVVYSSCHHYCSTVSISMVLPTYIKEC